MIFASDLDRTLIYSKKLIEDRDKDVVLVEKYEGKDLSFMKRQVINKLMDMQNQNKILFIPVTTRTIDQYNRIFIMSEKIKPFYAVVSNGGNILINGQKDRQWREIINKKINKIIDHSLVKKKFLESFTCDKWIRKIVLRDEIFYSVHFDNKELINHEELRKFKKWAYENEWDISLQSKKLYIVPKCVNKWDALLYIKEKENKSKIISAGDSYLDYPILINADYPICAAHGELKYLMKNNEIEQGHISITKESGIKASEEIIQRVYNFI